MYKSRDSATRCPCYPLCWFDNKFRPIFGVTPKGYILSPGNTAITGGEWDEDVVAGDPVAWP